MNCPYCGSTHLEESSNFNEYSCNFCKCEFKNDEGKVRIFEDGNYKKFCESVMYNLCESASPKVSNVLVSVISQLKNNGVEEIDAILEHLMLVAGNVSSEMVIGLQTQDELDVVNEGIKHFTTIGNTLLKRDDLELDLSRFTRFQESNAFYESEYKLAPSLKGDKMRIGAVDEATIPTGTEVDQDGLPLNPEGIEASAGDIPGVIGGVSDNLPGAMDMVGDVDDVPPVSMAPMPANQMGMSEPPSPEDLNALGAAQDADVAEMGAGPLPPDMGGAPTQFSPEEMNQIAEVMANGYRDGSISEEADFAEALMNCEAANGLNENLGAMSEEQVYEVAQMVQSKLEELSASADEDGNLSLTPGPEDQEPDVRSEVDITSEQLQEAIEILSSSLKLSEEELKDL